jgi:hypothetical protein
MKKLSEEHKRNLSKSHARYWLGKHHSSETKNKMSKARVGKKPMLGKHHSVDTKKKLSEKGKGRKFSIETKKKLSKARKRTILRQKLNPGRGNLYSKKGKFRSIKNKEWLFYRSTYELYVFRILEKMPMVEKYEVEPFGIPYRADFNNVRIYFPDLLIYFKNGSKKLIEIKPLTLVNDSINMKKFKAAKIFADIHNMTFSVWTEKEIFKHRLRKPVRSVVQ